MSNFIKSHDFCFGNLETTDHNRKGYPEAFPGGGHAMSAPATLKDLKDFGFNVFGTANNHSMDFGRAGLNRTAEALHELFHPDKINFGAYGDTMHHLHFHLVPKYRDGFEWGGVFAMNPGREKLAPEGYEELIALIRSKLQA